ASGQLLVVSGFCLAIIGRYEEGMSYITRALQLADEVGDATLAGHAQTWKAGIHHVHMESRAAVESGGRGAELLRAAGDLGPLSLVLTILTFSSTGVADFSGTHRWAAEAGPLAERLGDHGSSMLIGRGLAMA